MNRMGNNLEQEDKITDKQDSIKLNQTKTIENACDEILLKPLDTSIKKQPDENYPQLTMEMFFEFMRTAYQVNDSFDGLSSVLAAHSEIDWSELAKIDLNLQSGNSKSIGTDQVGTGIEDKSTRRSSGSQEEHDDKKNDGANSNKNSDLQSPSKKSKTPKSAGESLEVREHLLSKMMKKNLSDVLHEGLLDSVLPYMLPKPTLSQPIIKKHSVDIKKSSSLNNNVDKSSGLSSANRDKDKDRSKIHRKSLETEVEIHVCDESKNIKKDFRCPQKLLIQKMCYFADVTAGQKLEEMDISVHCDIVIFDWLMRWVKKDIIKKSEWPVLEANNVIPITVSASFLQMEPLLEQCLVFCHENMSEVLKTSTILTCLNDNIFTRLADLFTNVDVETLKDKKDKVQSRLFCKLIMSLADPTPDNRRGHYSSLATLFKCNKCGKNVIRSVSDTVPCVPSAMKIDTRGNIYSKHSRDLTWSLNDYIVNLRSELRSWRKVYWRLWGDCHFLYCRQCNTHFPINQMDWCSHHPEIPQFFANEQQRSAPYPLGRYPCCSQRAYRFEALPNREGCRFKEHIPTVSVDNDGHVLNIFTLYRDILTLDPPQLFFPEKITRLVTRDSASQSGKLMCKEPMPWDGIELAPSRPKLGLLAKVWGGSGVRRPCQTNAAAATTGGTVVDGQNKSRKLIPQNSQVVDTPSPNTSTSDSDDDDGITACGDTSIDDDSDNNSEESHGWPLYKPTGKIKRRHPSKRQEGGRCWNMNLLVKYNQDNQRDFEERAACQMIGFLTKRTSAECLITKMHKNSHTSNTQSIGGSYVKLEAEFREQTAHSAKVKNNSHGKGLSRSRTLKP
ncbi:SANT and BTB domain regulator of class switch recombination [Microplitis demolitor]|uniref:SANT and BTB domain regulator of class switch recombination n=1 Tax=Microplitis demolitor TaxID=69319 RepID=UPI0004CD3F9B|nr:SANT and BTB domain regulator of class switch recombination [Microplitis demolitor]